MISKDTSAAHFGNAQTPGQSKRKAKAAKIKRPIMFALGGLSGSGKTSLGMALAKAFNGAALIDSDKMRKDLHGIDPQTPLPNDAYTPEQNERFIRYTHRAAQHLLRTRDIVIVSATFLDEASRANQEKLARNMGADFMGLWLNVPFETLSKRVAARTDTASDADLAILEKQRETARQHPECLNHGWTLINGNQPLHKVFREASDVIEKALSSKRIPPRKKSSLKTIP